MKHVRSVALAPVLLACAIAPAPAAGDPVWEGFRSPPATARPFVRWWWNGDKVTKEEILRELDLMKAAGIGGVEINSIKFPANPANASDPLGVPALDWLSPAWCEMVKVATDGARARGLTADIIVGSGWPFGGRFLPREHQTKILTVGRKKVMGPAPLVLTEAEVFALNELTLHSKHDDIARRVHSVRLTPARLEKFDAGTDVSAAFRDGRLTVDVPPGEHVVHCFVVQEGFQAVINGAPGSDGPVLNHFSRAATEFYLNHMSDGMKPHLGRLGDRLRGFFCDSLELEGANWNPDLPDEFCRRRGYDLLPWLPYVMFKTGQMGDAATGDTPVEMGAELQDQVNRVRYDQWLTLIELFRERFLEPFVQWCRAQGGQSRVQAYGHGYHPLESSLLVDLPECETWLNLHTGGPLSRGAATQINKFVSSGARLAGKRLVSAEEITDTNYVFFTPLEMIKIAGDESNLSGVTHSILHGFNYSPPAAGFPGWVRYGTYFNEHNPWWPHVSRWFDYKARLSWLLQQAEPQANIAILHPLADLWSRWGMQRDPFPRRAHPAYAHEFWQALHRHGFNCDYTSENILCASTMANGTAAYGPCRYSVIVLMEVDTIRPDTAAALERFVRAGGRLVAIGRPPSAAPGLLARGAQDEEVRATMQRVFAEHPKTCRIVPAPVLTPPRVAGAPTISTPAPQPGEELLAWLGDHRASFGAAPDVAFDRPSVALSQMRHRIGDRDVFFLANTSREQTVRVRAQFRTVGRTPWQWDPEAGTRRVLPWVETRQTLDLTFAPAESKLVVFEPAEAPAPPREPAPVESDARPLAGPWTVQLEHMNGGRAEIALEQLADLGKLPGQEGFGGEAVYRLAFTVDASPSGWRFLDLGTVREISTAALDGRPLGVRWYGRHLYDLGPAPLRPGRHELVVRVTTVCGNYARSLKDNATAQRWVGKHQPRPMGLLGPVRLLRAE